MPNDWALNTQPEEYAFPVAGSVSPIRGKKNQASSAVVRALQATDARVKTHGFRKAVTLAVFDDALAADGIEDAIRPRLVERVKRRYGAKRWLQVFETGVELLSSWKFDESNFIPDAYLVDSQRKTVVCYEVEDTHPLKPPAVQKYAGAWWLLETIHWDLHLLAYDIYGNCRSVALPHAEHIAAHAIHRLSTEA